MAYGLLSNGFALMLSSNNIEGNGVAIATDSGATEIVLELTTATGGSTQSRTTDVLASIRASSAMFTLVPLADISAASGSTAI